MGPLSPSPFCRVPLPFLASFWLPMTPAAFPCLLLSSAALLYLFLPSSASSCVSLSSPASPASPASDAPHAWLLPSAALPPRLTCLTSGGGCEAPRRPALECPIPHYEPAFICFIVQKLVIKSWKLLAAIHPLGNKKRNSGCL